MAAVVAVRLAAAGPPEPEQPAPAPLPEGQPAPLPNRVDWKLTATPANRTRTRLRLPLEGLWRFAPVPARDTPVQRAEMGWIQMPGLWTEDRTQVFDPQFHVADRLWQGRPLQHFTWAWAERDITTTGAWFRYRIFLFIAGPWARAEVYCFGQKLQGEQQPEGLRFELTEALVYPGTTQLSLCLHQPGPAAVESQPRLATELSHRSGTSQKPNLPAGKPPPKARSAIYLELIRSGPRVDTVRLARDPDTGELMVSVKVVRPMGFLLPVGPNGRLPDAVLTVQVEEAETGRILHKSKHTVGSLARPSQWAKMPVPLTDQPQGQQPQLARLLLLLHSSTGQLYDQPFPLLFRPDQLSPAADHQGGQRP